MSRKGGTAGGGWINPESETNMAMSWIGGERPLVKPNFFMGCDQCTYM